MNVFFAGILFFSYNFASLVLESGLLRFSTVLLDPSPITFVAAIGIWLGAGSLGTWLATCRSRVRRGTVPLLLASMGISGLFVWAAVTDLLSIPGGDALGPVLGNDAARWVVAGLLFSVPAFLSGCIFPLFSEMLEGPGSRRATLSLSFGGSSLGVIGGSFLLLPRIGIGDTVLFSAAVLLVAAVATGIVERAGAPWQAPEPEGPFRLSTDLREVRIACGAAFLSGVLTPAIQGSLYRVHMMIAGGTTYSAGIAVGTFLLGLSIGAILSGGEGRSAAPPSSRIVHALSASAILVSAAVLLVPFLGRAAGSIEAHRPMGLSRGIVILLFPGATLFLLPAVAIGRILPLSLKTISFHGKHSGEWRIGYLLYSLGAVFGGTAVSLSSSVLGTRLLLLLTGMSCLVALAASAYSLRSSRSEGFRYAGVVPLLLWLVAALFPWELDSFEAPYQFPGGVPAAVHSPPEKRSVGSRLPDPGGRVLFRKEGLYGITSLHRSGDAFSLRWNGFGVSHSVFDAATQRMLALLPILFGRPSSALVIGLGSGQTFADLVRAGISDAWCVELSPDIVEASRNYGGRYPFPEDRVIVGDAKRYLEGSHDTFDLIVSQPSHPWFSGSGNLFTEDFYRTAASHLSPEGVFCQWMQTYGSDREDILLLLRTFGTVFPMFTVWSPAPGDILLLGRRRLVGFSLREWTDRLSDPVIHSMLGDVGITGPEDLLGMFLFSDREVPRSSGPVSTYDRPLLEYGTAWRIGLDRTETIGRFLDVFCNPPPPELTFPDLHKRHSLARRTGQSLAVQSKWIRAERWLLAAWKSGNDPGTANDLAMVYHSSEKYREALAWIRIAKTLSNSEDIEYNYRRILESAGREHRRQSGDRSK